MSYRQALSLLNRGRANPSDYKVILPSRVLDYSPQDKAETDDYAGVFCRAVSIPGAQNNMQALTGHENIGINRNVITGRNFGTPLVLTYTERSDMLIYTMLKRWLDSGIINSPQRSGFSRSLRVNYYDAVKCDIILFKYEPFTYDNESTRDELLSQEQTKRGHRRTAFWHFKNCIPQSIEQAGLSLDMADSFLDFSMTIAYESFEYMNLVPGYDLSLDNVAANDDFNIPSLNLF